LSPFSEWTEPRHFPYSDAYKCDSSLCPYVGLGEIEIDNESNLKVTNED